MLEQSEYQSCPSPLVPAGPGSMHRCSPGGGAGVRAGGVPGGPAESLCPKIPMGRAGGRRGRDPFVT